MRKRLAALLAGLFMLCMLTACAERPQILELSGKTVESVSVSTLPETSKNDSLGG